MTACPFCGAQNAPDAEKCISCGRSLVSIHCPHCGALNAARDTYCAHCFNLLRPTEESDEILGKAAKIVKTALPEGMSAEPESELPQESSAQPGAKGGLSEIPRETEEPPAEPIPDQDHQQPIVSTPDAAIESIEGILEVSPRTMESYRSMPKNYRRATSRESELATLWQQISLKHAPMDEGRHNLPSHSGKETSPRQRILIFVLTFALALFPVLSGGGGADALAVDEPSPSPLAMELSTIPIDQPLLVSFDYEPSYSGELGNIAKESIGYLVERHVPLLTMTTHPLSADMAALVISTADLSTSSEIWTDLGYTPSRTGLRVMSESWQHAFPFATDPFNTQSAAQVSRALVFSDSYETCLAWLEVFGPQVDLPIQMVVTERIYPLLLPYQESGQLDLLITGSSTTFAPDTSQATGDYSVLVFSGVLVLAAWATLTPGPLSHDRGD